MPKASPARPAVADDINLDDIKSFEAFTEKFPNIANESRLRWWIYHRKSNGLEASGAVIKRAGRWFVVVPRLKAWLLTGSAQAA
jgi:hypothetical protein